MDELCPSDSAAAGLSLPLRRARVRGGVRRGSVAGAIGKIGTVLCTTWLVLAATGAQAAPIHTDYAILFSGGVDQDNNRPRYYDQTLRMWTIATQTLGFAAQNVYVLFADGTDPYLDLCVNEGGFCNDHISSDWSVPANAGSPVRGRVAKLVEIGGGGLPSVE